MNIHAFLDSLVSLPAFFLKNKKYFRDSITSKTIAENLDNISLSVPEIKGEGVYEVTAETLIGRVNPAFKIAQWKGKEYTTIIYHHGASEIPYDFSFNKVFPVKKKDIPANLIAIRSAFSKSTKDFTTGIKDVSSYIVILTVSVVLTEKIIKYCRKQGVEEIVFTGLSLGGFVGNLHHLYYNNADIYKPILAGTKIADALLDEESTYHKMASSRARIKIEDLRKLLNFDKEFSQKDNSNVYPLLGKYDGVIKYNVQSKSYDKERISTMNKGHLTGSISFNRIREHILENSL